MKKILLVTLLALAATTVQAADNFGKIEYAFRDIDGDAPNKNGLNITVGHKFNPSWAIDGKAEIRVENGTESVSNRLELGTTYSEKNLFVRGSVGEKFKEGSSFAYYTVEPGAKFDLTKDLKLIGSYRYRNAFNTSNDDETHRAQVGAEYSLDKTSAVTASVGRSWGDTQYNSVNVGYKVNF